MRFLCPTSSIVGPILAYKLTTAQLSRLYYPILTTPKFDGIRCLILRQPFGRVAFSRHFKEIQNKHVREYLLDCVPTGCDGELMLKNRRATFQEITSSIMTRSGEPDFRYHVFDHVQKRLDEPYRERIARLKSMSLPDRCRKVIPDEVFNEEELLWYEADYVARHYEGLMGRNPNSPYKCGRGGLRNLELFKLKRFEDDEAEIIGFEEECTNTNEAKKDAFGRTERSSHKANRVGKNRLGALHVRWHRIEFSIGSGYTAKDRDELWKVRNTLIGQKAKFRYQPVGVKEAPRFPTFLGIRHPFDL